VTEAEALWGPLGWGKGRQDRAATGCRCRRDATGAQDTVARDGGGRDRRGRQRTSAMLCWRSRSDRGKLRRRIASIDRRNPARCWHDNAISVVALRPGFVVSRRSHCTWRKSRSAPTPHMRSIFRRADPKKYERSPERRKVDVQLTSRSGLDRPRHASTSSKEIRTRGCAHQADHLTAMW